MRTAYLITIVLALAGSTACLAQPEVEELPGYFPLEELGILQSEELSVEVNLKGALLRLVAAAVSQEDEEFAELVSGLDLIRVQVAPTSSVDGAETRRRIAAASKRLDAEGWLTIVRTRDDEEEVLIYAREVGGEFVGLAVLAMDGDSDGDVALINIVGPIDPSRIASLGEMLDIPQIEDAVGNGQDN